MVKTKGPSNWKVKRRVKRGEQFYCGGCAGQKEVAALCSRWWNNIKGLCWYFAECFRNKCIDKYGSPPSPSAQLALCERWPRKAGDKASDGHCLEFNWGGLTGVHWYSCCNNCKNGNATAVVCDKKTYHTASSGIYCGSCGVDLKAGDGSKRGEQFYCGGCAGQEEVAALCSRWWNNIKGMCWHFSKCFHDKCTDKYGYAPAPSQPAKAPPTCYDGKCQAGETTKNCPIDCCYKINPKCHLANLKNTCMDKCCSDEKCCGTGKGNVIGLNHLHTLLIFIFGLLMNK
ncbi:uncharacterized protein LOC141902067 [Tubulanus polymorphus]|uniref:uncharacterized protein LOC141902067 n=1 Tax=Tubulanus polymorphus TaxID=672921 RepID=UPI003DA435D1